MARWQSGHAEDCKSLSGPMESRAVCSFPDPFPHRESMAFGRSAKHLEAPKAESPPAPEGTSGLLDGPRLQLRTLVGTLALRTQAGGLPGFRPPRSPTCQGPREHGGPLWVPSRSGERPAKLAPVEGLIRPRAATKCARRSPLGRGCCGPGWIPAVRVFITSPGLAPILFAIPGKFWLLRRFGHGRRWHSPHNPS